MMKKQSKFLAAGLIALSMIGFSCEDGASDPQGDINDPDAPKGQLSMSITDAPIDGANVSGAFVTITEIKVDGQTYNGFQGPKTVNLLELQNGNSLNLGNSEVAAGSYSKIEMVINSEADATNSGPGCYILKSDGTKEKLELSGGSTTAITMQPSDFKVTESGQTEIIMDFDLRKAVKSNTDNSFSFVSNSELNAAVRAENKAMTGHIKGKIENYSSAQSNIVVFVYKKGSFNESTEVNASGSNEVKYANAVTSAKVDAAGNFTLAFLPEGNYEIHCDKPENNGSSGIGLNTLLDLESSVDLSNVGVNAGAETNLALTVKLDGIINL